MDRVRAALTSSSPSRALAVLREYDAHCPNGIFAEHLERVVGSER